MAVEDQACSTHASQGLIFVSVMSDWLPLLVRMDGILFLTTSTNPHLTQQKASESIIQLLLHVIYNSLPVVVGG
jgi:hypothetical protein